MIISKLNRIIKLNSVCVAFPDICCVVAGVAELMDVTVLQQISLEIFQFLIDHTYVLLTVVIEEADVLEALVLEADVLAALVLL
jgi:hypothetical protein